MLVFWVLCSTGYAHDYLDYTKEKPGKIEGKIHFHFSNISYNKCYSYRHQIILWLHTEKHYCPFSIVSDVSVFGKNITVKILGIKFDFPQIMPSDYLRLQETVDNRDIQFQPLFPATSMHIIDIPNGIYNLQFQYKDRADSYRLIIFKPFIKILKIKSNFTRPDGDFFYKYSTIYGKTAADEVEEKYGNYLKIILLIVITYIISIWLRIMAKRKKKH